MKYFALIYEITECILCRKRLYILEWTLKFSCLLKTTDSWLFNSNSEFIESYPKLTKFDKLLSKPIIEILSGDSDDNPIGLNGTYPYLIGSDRDGCILLSGWLSKKNGEWKWLTIPKKLTSPVGMSGFPVFGFLLRWNVNYLAIFFHAFSNMLWYSNIQFLSFGHKSSFVLGYSGKSILVEFQETVIYTGFRAPISTNLP
jgi:hypothetical protein